MDYLSLAHAEFLFKIIFGQNYFISEPIFKTFAALFMTFGLQKDDMIIFLVVFQKSEILKTAVSERLCTDSTQHYVSLITHVLNGQHVNLGFNYSKSILTLGIHFTSDVYIME